MICREFEAAGVNIRVCENLMLARWEKLVWNMPFNGLSVVLNSTTDQLMQDNDARTLVREIMVEVITGATRCGYFIDDGFMEIMLEATENMASYSPSMKLDFDAGRLLEIEQVYWQPIKTAQSVGFHMEKSRVIALQLESLNRQKRGLK
jgi:2-dehydropantoate 2-reductase